MCFRYPSYVTCFTAHASVLEISWIPNVFAKHCCWTLTLLYIEQHVIYMLEKACLCTLYISLWKFCLLFCFNRWVCKNSVIECSLAVINVQRVWNIRNTVSIIKLALTNWQCHSKTVPEHNKTSLKVIFVLHCPTPYAKSVSIIVSY